MRSPPLIFAFLLLHPCAALCNDTMAELKTGGLVFVQTPDVEMTREDLFISRDEIRVDYVFRNLTDKPVSGLVAFPLPDIAGSPEGNIAIGDFQADNFLDFSATQDGKPVDLHLQQRAIAVGLDVTDDLVAHGVPLLPFADATISALQKLAPDVLADFRTRGMTFPNTYDEGGGMKTVETPFWTLRSAYWWKADFPPGRDIHVLHRYRPSVGGTVAVTFFEDGQPRGKAFEDYKARYCMDDSFVKAAMRLPVAGADGMSPYTEAWISYILTTGANWAGPIKSFTLTVDKGDARNLISFCGDTIKKTGTTTFTMTAQDFYPEKDIDILILQRSTGN